MVDISNVEGVHKYISNVGSSWGERGTFGG